MTESDTIGVKQAVVPEQTAAPFLPYRNMRAILYARVSTDDKGQTTETQIREMRQWCERNGVKIVDEYEEEESGKSLEDADGQATRKVFDSVMGRLQRGGINILLARDPSRISRDGKDMENIVAMVEGYGAVIRYSSADNIAPEDDNGALLNKISTWQGEIERKKLSANTKKGMEQAKIEGTHCGRMLAFCFSHRVLENEKRIQTNGKQNTYIASVDTVMDFARQGITYTRVAHEIMHISPDTLKSALIHEGLFADYQDLCRKARGKPQEGVSPTRGAETPETVPTRGEVS